MFNIKMASRLLRREVCKRLVRHRTLVAAKKVNEQKNFISLLHQQILNNLKDSKIDNLYPIGKGDHKHFFSFVFGLVPFPEIRGRQLSGSLTLGS